MRAIWSLRILMLLCFLGLALQGCGGGGGGGSDTSPIVNNTSPIANAGTAQSVTTGTVVTLDGSGSSDADGDPLVYSWSFSSKPAGSNAVLSNVTAVKPTFTAEAAGTYVLSLVANDGKVASAASTVTITAKSPAVLSFTDKSNGTIYESVNNISWLKNTNCFGMKSWNDAMAIVSQLASGQCGLSDGSKAGDWRLPTYIEAELLANAGYNSGSLTSAGFTNISNVLYWTSSNSTSVSNDTVYAFGIGPDNIFVADNYLKFIAPNVGWYSWAVRIGNSVSNSAPVANAGAAQSVVTGAVVTLDGSASSDANGDPLTYSWSFISKPVGSSAVLSSTTAINPTFNASVAGTYVLSLVVNDGKVNSEADSVTINIRKPIEVVYTVANGPTSDSLCYYNGNINFGGYVYNFNNCLMYGSAGSPLVAKIYNNTNTAYTINSLTINYSGGFDDSYIVNETLSPNSSMRYDLIMHFYNELGQSEAIFDLTQIGAVSGKFTLTATP